MPVEKSGEVHTGEEASIETRMEKVLNSIPERGPSPETEKLFSAIRNAIFPEDYLAHLRSLGLNVEKVSTGLSKNKIEITMVIQYPDIERQVNIRYRKDEGVTFRLQTGVWDVREKVWNRGEKVLYQEKLSGSMADIVSRVRNIVEGLVAPK